MAVAVVEPPSHNYNGIGKMCFPAGIGLVSAFGESRDLVFPPSRADLVVQSSRLAGFVQNREIYNLSMGSRPVLKKMMKNKRSNLVCSRFRLSGSTKQKQN